MTADEGKQLGAGERARGPAVGRRPSCSSTGSLPLALNMLLPDLPSAEDECASRFREMLLAKTGISDAHLLIETSEGAPERLCVHFDASKVSVREVCEFARRAGAQLEDQFGHFAVNVGAMHARKARRIGEDLCQRPGILEASIAPDGACRVEFDRSTTDESGVRAAMGEVLGAEQRRPPPAEGAHELHAHGGILGERAELLLSALSGALLLVGWGASLASLPSWTSMGAYGGAYVLGGFFPLREAIANLRRGRFEIDFLMLVAAVGAATLGEWAEGALLLFLFSLGHGLEGYAMGRARRAIESLSELAPDTARVRRGGVLEDLPVEELQVGDTVVVKPNERLPADGVVVKGESSVNQAPITGESVPVDKRPVEDGDVASADMDGVAAESRVFAGTINGSGALEVRVSQTAGESTLARLVRMVSEAETNRSPTQRLTDRFERIFVPLVLAIALLMLFGWAVVDEPFSASFYRAMAVLVAASPCALAIATPSAVLSGVARAARGGVLVKGGSPLENLGRLEAVAFDKTGTLTEGRPRLVAVVASMGVEVDELLRVAVGVEMLSDHPLAAAVERDGKARLGKVPPATASALHSISGRGVRAVVEGMEVVLGKVDLFDEIGGPPLHGDLRLRVRELEGQGRSTVVVRHGGRYLGVLGLMDTPRPGAASVIEHLRRIGIRRMIMISGDNQQVATAIAKEVGLDEARGDLMPDDKVAAIQSLRAEGLVAMVGDGVNDAPAMASATVGIAMGAAGSDVALETADVALMADDLGRLPFAIGLSRATRRAIRQNLWMSLGVVALLVPATILGLGIGPAVAVHEGSTLVVVLNALRLLAFKEG